MESTYKDLIIIGAGPCGLACAIEAEKEGLDYLVLEKGSLAESVRRYPKQMTFFSTADNISVGNIPFTIERAKATRNEALNYYRKVSDFFGLKLSLRTPALHIEKKGGLFYIKSTEGRHFSCRYLISAIGYFDKARKLGIPGEMLPHVSYYYDEPYAYIGQKVVIVGGGNSAVGTALELYHHGIDVTIVHRRDEFKKTIKYWLLPDLQNRIKAGDIKALMNCKAEEIQNNEILLQNLSTGERFTQKADTVFLLIGHTPDVDLMKSAGVEVSEDAVPKFDENTFESNTENLFVAGTVICGVHTERVFIENGRHHGKVIIQELVRRLASKSGI